MLRIRHLRRSELPYDTTELARYLIGKVVVRELPQGRMSGRIVETEAYPPGDSSSHAFRGVTPRNRSLFLTRGYAYVYFIYGVSYMLNVSSEVSGVGAGVLVRALEPMEGIDLMAHHRGTSRLWDLARGPGRLAAALKVDRGCDGVNLCAAGPLWLGVKQKDDCIIKKSVRIGITREIERKLRFYEHDNPFVSGQKWLRI